MQTNKIFTYNSFSVDWAALAQQWIKYKETAVPLTPPPPPILGSLSSTSNDGGPVPMDMDTKDDDIPPAPPAPTISGTGKIYILKILFN